MTQAVPFLRQKAKELKEVFNGQRPCDLLIKGARVVDLFGGEVIEGPVAIHKGEVIALEELSAREVFDARGLYLVPGFVDSHLHIESTLLVPHQFARAVLKRGTVAVFADPHEIANVLGLEGIRFMIEDSEGLPVDIFFLLPSCVPATPFETSGASLGPEDLRGLKAHPRVVGLGEFMDVQGLLKAEEGTVEKLALFEDGVIDGHGPLLGGKELSYYLCLGIGSDHETVGLEEGREKLRKGLFLYLREGTSERNLRELIPLLSPFSSERFGFASDDRSPVDLLHRGHIDDILRQAVAQGLDPLLALKAACLNPFRHFRLRGRGAVAPGYRADLSLLKDLEGFEVIGVMKGGRWVFLEGEYRLPFPGRTPPTESPFAVPPAEVLRRKMEVRPEGRRLRAIGLVEGEIVTVERVLEVPRGTGVLEPRALGVPKVVVVERYEGSGRTGVGFLQGLGIEEGALGTTIAHDSHNLVVAGMSDEEILLAVEALRRSRGGMVVVRGGRVLGHLPLPVAGLMSERPYEEVAALLEELEEAAQDLGSKVLPHPFMYLSFVALPVIPELRLTDRGLFDVKGHRFVPLTF